MRFLHLADLHIGKLVNNIAMVKEDQPFVLKQVLQILKERKIDVLVLAGDIYDKSSPSEEAVRLFDWFISEVAALKVPCLIISGNHDSADRLAYARLLLEKQGVYISPVFNGEIEKVQFEDENGLVNFWLLPNIRPIDARRALQDESIGSDYTAATKAVLKNAGVDAAQRNVLVAHQFVTAGSSAPERASEETTVGGLDNVDVDAFSDFDYVALGHIHRGQHVGRKTVRYAGSPMKYSIGEAHYEKSAVLVELGPKSEEDEVGACVSFELVPLIPLHEMREIKGPLDELVSIDIVSQGDSSDYVQVVLTDENKRLDAIEKVRAAYPNYMSISYESDSNRTAEMVASAPDPEEENPEDLFSRFFEECLGKPLSDEQSELARKCMQKAELSLEGGQK